MTLSTWNETFDVLYKCLDIFWLAPPLYIVDPLVIFLFLRSFSIHLDGLKMDKALSQYTIGVYFTLQLMPCYSLIGVFAWMNNFISWDSEKREKREKRLNSQTVFPYHISSVNFVHCLFNMDMLYFGDSVPYTYQPGYKQGNYCDFPSACAYPGMGSIPNTACRFSSVSSSYGTYPLPPGACSGFFARKPARIKGITHFYHVFCWKCKSNCTHLALLLKIDIFSLEFYTFHYYSYSSDSRERCIEIWQLIKRCIISYIL